MICTVDVTHSWPPQGASTSSKSIFILNNQNFKRTIVLRARPSFQNVVKKNNKNPNRKSGRDRTASRRIPLELSNSTTHFILRVWNPVFLIRSRRLSYETHYSWRVTKKSTLQRSSSFAIMKVDSLMLHITHREVCNPIFKKPVPVLVHQSLAEVIAR